MALFYSPDASSYDQEALLSQAPTASFARVRSNSYNQSPHNHNEPGPLARIPSPDPDHIDGLHRPNGTSTPTSSTPSSVLDSDSSIPPFTFEDHPALPRPSSPDRITMNTTHHPQPSHGLFNLTNMNSSAPALSTTYGHPVPPPLTHRAATTPAKRLAFAANLSIYDTFSPHVYDRRSEPATCNRLTPALAQRIKEELNSYKMEEMEVHAASRVQCVQLCPLFFGCIQMLIFLSVFFPARNFSYDQIISCLHSILDPSFFVSSLSLYQRNLHHPPSPHPSPTLHYTPTLNQQFLCADILAPLLLYPCFLNVKTPDLHNPPPSIRIPNVHFS